MQHKNSIIRNDIFLILVLLLLSAAGFTILLFTRHAGKNVEVFVDGQMLYSYSLSDTVNEVINTKWGENHLVIEEGKVFILEADCPDKLCVRQKEIDKNGESIVCLPHKLVVSVTGGEEREIDAITK